MTRFTALLLSLFLWTVGAQAEGLVASVDRSRVNSGETVELTLESNDVTPQQNGTIVIPPLQLGDEQSQPVSLQVVESESQDSANTLAPVFIETSLDQDTVYVQAQAILTLRIYHSVSLYDDSSLTPLQIPDARVEQLGESRTYEKVINDLRHGVIERRYAIYPQHSGLLTIPAQMFSAILVEPQPTQDLATQEPKSGKLMRVNSAETQLTVKAKPDDYPTDVPWLPARSLSLSESWSPEPYHSQVGDSLIHSLIVKAEDLSSSQLPPLPATEVNGLRRYPGQPQLSSQPSDQGLIGSREEREALVPTRTGQIQLPPVEVVWWNTHENHLERSSLPARTLHVVNNPSLVVDTPTGNAPLAVTADSEALRYWKLSTLFLACTTLLGFGLWWRARWQPAILRTAQTGPSPRTLLDDLKRASQANDPHATRQSLDAWARQQPENLADMAARFVPLSDALDGLNGALYSETGQHWQGEELWRAICAIPIAERVQDPVGDSGLPPLYPK
jgi:hypothetical protein